MSIHSLSNAAQLSWLERRVTERKVSGSMPSLTLCGRILGKTFKTRIFYLVLCVVWKISLMSVLQ